MYVGGLAKANLQHLSLVYMRDMGKCKDKLQMPEWQKWTTVPHCNVRIVEKSSNEQQHLPDKNPPVTCVKLQRMHTAYESNQG